MTFEIGEETQPQPQSGQEEEDRGWECVWSCHTATPVFHMSFSPDGTLFATAGKSDRLVKIWFENKQCKFHYHVIGIGCCEYDFILMSECNCSSPCNVTSFSIISLLFKFSLKKYMILIRRSRLLICENYLDSTVNLSVSVQLK